MFAGCIARVHLQVIKMEINVADRYRLLIRPEPVDKGKFSIVGIRINSKNFPVRIFVDYTIIRCGGKIPGCCIRNACIIIILYKG